MSFNYDNTDFVSFATVAEVALRDQRLFEVNEGLTDELVETLLAQASQRILTQLRNTDWWKLYNFERNTDLNRDTRLLPEVNPDRIVGRVQEFKDLNIYFCLSEYCYPRVADFGNPNDSGVEKIKFYLDQYSKLFKETVESGDWYDYDADGTVETNEKKPVKLNLVRVR